MVGKQSEKEFDVQNYEKFYEHHLFQPMSEQDAFNVHEIVPRFGWALDIIDERTTPVFGASARALRVLDLGCLDGSFLLTLQNNIDYRIRADGVDLTQDGIDIARARAKSRGWQDSIHFNQGTIEGWLQHYIDNDITFDVVTLFEVIEHVKDPTHVLKLIDQVLAPGGTVLVSTPAFEAPTFGMDDEQNKCHIRLYTTEDEDYEAVNRYGNTRKATSITKEIGKDRIKEIGVYSELINVRYSNGRI